MLNLRKLWEIAEEMEHTFGGYTVNTYTIESPIFLFAEKCAYALLQKLFVSGEYQERISFSDTIHYWKRDFYPNTDADHSESLSETGEILARNDLCSWDDGGYVSLYNEMMGKNSGWDYSLSWGTEDPQAYNDDTKEDPVVLAENLFPDNIPLPKEGDKLYRALSGYERHYLENTRFYLFWNKELLSFLKWEETYRGRFKGLTGAVRKIIYNKFPDLLPGAELLYCTKEGEKAEGDAYLFLYCVDIEIEVDKVSTYVLFYMYLVDEIMHGLNRMYHFLDGKDACSSGREAA